MKKTILAIIIGAICLSFAAPLVAQEQFPEKHVSKSFGYMSLGLGPLPIPLPSIGVGFRSQNGHFGTDFALDMATVIAATHLSVTPSVLWYPNPNPKSQFYAGFGINIGGVFGAETESKRSHTRVFGPHGCHGYYDEEERPNNPLLKTVIPQLILGKNYQNKNGGERFLQANIGYPAITNEGTLRAPLVTVKYGFGF